MKRLSMKALVVAATLGCACQAVAVQYIDGNSAKSTASISDSEPTRVSIEGSKIRSIQTTKGEIDYQKDDENGQIFLTPKVKKNISLFVNSESGRNYLLTLKPSKQEADSIVIREAAAQSDAVMQAQRYEQTRQRDAVRNSEPYTSGVKRFIYGIANKQEEEFGITCSIDGESVPLWNEVVFIKKRTCTDGVLTGFEFVLSNATSSMMVLEEQEFFKKNVIAVALDKLQIAPDESTRVFVISGGLQ